MDLYTTTSYALSRQLTLRYSTSFSTSSKLFSTDIRQHIFAIYGLVRIADEIVDTYEGVNKATVLSSLESEVHASIETGYSANPIVHAFADTVRKFTIPSAYIKAFFKSMRMDLHKKTFTQKEYETYIYGSAEVIGLMCLKVFTYQDTAQFSVLEPAAKALGAAYQKVNFLRDIASDYSERGRVYFPGVSIGSFNDQAKTKIIKDIQKDFDSAQPALKKLPKNASKAVSLSVAYYTQLLKQLEQASAQTIKSSRVRVPDSVKLKLLVAFKLSGKAR